MRIGFLVVCVAAAAGTACAGWTRTAVLGTNATSSTVLAEFRLLSGDVDGMPAVAATRPVTGDVPVVPAVGDGLDGEVVPGSVDGVGPVAGGNSVGVADLWAAVAVAGLKSGSLYGGFLAYVSCNAGNSIMPRLEGFGQVKGTARVGAAPVPVFAVAAGAAPCEVDPLLAMLDVWDDGPLGEMRARRPWCAGGGTLQSSTLPRPSIGAR